MTGPTPQPADTAEFTLKAIVAGVLLGIVFGAANAYIGLRVGLTVSAAIPAAVMAVAVFAALHRFGGQRSTILEANLAQTIGSASTSLASGTIFTIPALFMWGMAPPFFQIVVLSILGAVLGIAAMIPLRRLLIVDAHAELPYPEGTACAEVLRATAGGTTASGWIFRGIAVGVLVKVLVSIVFLMPSSVHAALPVLSKAEVALELAPALIGVGYILGYKASGVLVAGSLVSAVVLTPLIAYTGFGLTAPLAPEGATTIAEMTAAEIWSRYVRYIGAGAVAMAGIITVAKALPTMASAFAAVAKGLRSGGAGATGTAAPGSSAGVRGGGPGAAVPATDRDLPGGFVVGAVVVVVLIAALVPGVFAGEMGPLARAIAGAGVGFFGLMFVTVAARIVGIVGVSSQPTSGIALITLIGIASVFAAMGWTDANARAAVLTVGTVVAIAASKAGDISQSLKAGWLVGATPYHQQVGQLIGAAFACWAVAATVLLLGKVYTFGSVDVPAPQATLMKTIVEGVLAGALPWNLVLSGAGLAVGAWLTAISPLAFAIGVYLPLATMAAIYVGGLMRALAEQRAKDRSPSTTGDPGVLAASGLVAGEGLAGVLAAGCVALGWVPKTKPAILAGGLGEIAVLVTIALVCVFLVRAAERRAVR